MNVFEDLIGELKEENLLEETVIDVANPDFGDGRSSFGVSSASAKSDSTAMLERNDATPDAGASETDAEVSEFELYRKRVMDEVSSLQMVEHVLSGVEREHMKMSPATFDDLAVKKALHKFLQFSDDSAGSGEYSEAEQSLIRATEAWFSALSTRDGNISVANIRRFCENSRPVLSSQALIALARFYRNSPFSEPVRGKFDFVMTRLFSRELGEDKRKQLFPRGEMIGHIRTLYSNWSSLDLFSEGGHEDQIDAAVKQFDHFAAEAQGVERFDDLITSDFFNRIRVFKEQTAELFFAAEVAASAMDCNVKIGNRFVDLLRDAGEAANLDTIESKYGYTYDTLVSSAASKTIHLLEILKEERVARVDREQAAEQPATAAARPVSNHFERAPVDEASNFKLLSINRWLVVATILVLALSTGVYFWSENVSSSQGEVAQAESVNVTDPELRQHIRVARASSETLYGVAEQSWIAKPEDEQKELLAKALKMAESMKMKRVNILNNKGRTIGYATEGKIQVFGP